MLFHKTLTYVKKIQPHHHRDGRTGSGLTLLVKLFEIGPALINFGPGKVGGGQGGVTEAVELGVESVSGL